MSKLDIRFAVGTPDGAQSAIWRAWSQKDDIYVGHRSQSGVEKISFHASGICRKAFTQEFGVPDGLNDRVTVRWRRATTFPRGEGKGSLVLTIAFPTDYLTTKEQAAISKPVLWIPAGAAGHVRCVDMFFTLESKITINKLFGKNGQSLHTYTELPSSEKFVISSYATEWRGNPVKVPASLHEEQDLIFHQKDPDNTGRPVRLTMFNCPNDGDSLFCQELGGYRVKKNDPRFSEWVFDTLTRNKVFATPGRGEVK